jgi:hypothetical protein
MENSSQILVRFWSDSGQIRLPLMVIADVEVLFAIDPPQRDMLTLTPPSSDVPQNKHQNLMAPS